MSKTIARDNLLPIVLGGDIGAYALGREFHEAFGTKSIFINSGFIGAIEHSCIIDTHRIESMSADNLLSALSELAQDYADKTLVLVANTDPLIETLEDIHGELPENISCTIPSREAFDAVCDKDRFSRMCKEHDLDVPRMEVVSFAETTLPESSALDFPVVVKPAVSATWYDMLLKGFKKVYYLQSQSELNELWVSLMNVGFKGSMLVQELILGDDTYMDSLTIYMGRDGQAKLLGAAQVLLEDHAPTMLGNPVAMLIRTKKELWEKASSMLRDVGYVGFANFDVKRDPQTGRELFLDCNPRIGRNSYYNRAGGVNPMQVLVEDSVDGSATKTRIADKPALYSLIPLRLLKRYVLDPKLCEELERLISEKRIFDPQRYDKDWHLRRAADVVLTELNQYRKFRKFYPEPTQTSF